MLGPKTDTDLKPAAKQKVNGSHCFQYSQTLFKWIALGPVHEYQLRQSIQLSMFYTLHCVCDIHLSRLSTWGVLTV